MKRRHVLSWLILALVLALICGGIFWWRQAHAMTLERYDGQIEQAVAREDYELALSLCAQALKAYPQAGELYGRKAGIYYAQGEIELAIQTLDYGYKQTGLSALRTQRATYDQTVEENVIFHPARVESPEAQQEEQAEEYVPYQLPRVSLPDVVPSRPAQGEAQGGETQGESRTDGQTETPEEDQTGPQG